MRVKAEFRYSWFLFIGVKLYQVSRDLQMHARAHAHAHMLAVHPQYALHAQFTTHASLLKDFPPNRNSQGTSDCY